MNEIEAELLRTLKAFNDEAEYRDQQHYLRSLLQASEQLSDDEFEQLSEAAQEWVLTNIERYNANESLDDFPAPAIEDTAAAEPSPEAQQLAEQYLAGGASDEELGLERAGSELVADAGPGIYEPEHPVPELGGGADAEAREAPAGDGEEPAEELAQLPNLEPGEIAVAEPAAGASADAAGADVEPATADDVPKGKVSGLYLHLEIDSTGLTLHTTRETAKALGLVE